MECGCPWAGHHTGCPNKSTTSATPVSPAPLPVGWVCPKCGAGVAPTTRVCPCTPAVDAASGQRRLLTESP